MKRYPKYKDSGIEWIEEIPEHWKIVKLKRATQFLYGESLSNENRLDGKVPVYGSNGVTGYHNEAITKSPCIVIGRKGSFGKVNYSDKECFPIDTTFYIDTTATHNDLRWLYYLLLTVRLDSFSKDSAVPGLNREEAYEKIITLPPFSEQQYITNYLDRKTHLIDTLIENKQKLIGLLKEQRAAIINHAVTKGLNPNVKLKDSGIEWLGEIPEHWEVKKLKYAAKSVLTGSTPPTSEEKYYTDGIIDWFSPNDFGEDIRLLKVKRKISDIAIKDGRARLYEKHSVLLVGIGATLGKIGIIENSGSSNQQINAITFKNDFNPYFGTYYLQSISDVIVSFSNSATLPIFNQTQTKDIMILVPPKQEQGDIVKRIFEIDKNTNESIDKAKEQVELLKEYRTTLISEVVTGKIDVRDSEIPQVIQS